MNYYKSDYMSDFKAFQVLSFLKMFNDACNANTISISTLYTGYYIM